MTTPSGLPGERIRDLARQVDALETEAAKLIEGRMVRVAADFRDQPYGSSKPNLKGKTFRVAALFLCPEPVVWLATESGRVLGTGIALDKVEILDTEAP